MKVYLIEEGWCSDGDHGIVGVTKSEDIAKAVCHKLENRYYKTCSYRAFDTNATVEDLVKAGKS